MIEFIYIPIILFLYGRTWKYNTLIDDHVKRDGYMYEITVKKQDPKIYEVQRPIMATITNIGVFIAVCGYIHYFFGWKAALVYSVFPLNVSGVAWITGNYYMSTVLMVLSTHLLLHYKVLGTICAVLMYVAVLNSSLMGMSYFVIALLFPYGFTLLFPLLMFFRGKRWKAGVTQRVANLTNTKIIDPGKFKVRNLVRCPKVIAYYIALSIMPFRLGFFHSFGRNKVFFTKRLLVLSCVLCLLFWYYLLTINLMWAIWWFSSIALFSQFITLGQFTTERYTYLANVIFCAVVPLVITNDVLFAIVCTLYFIKSLEYIPMWRHNKYLFSYGMTQFPEAPENYSNLGSYYLDNNNAFEAIKPLMAAEKLTKDSLGDKYALYTNIAHTCLLIARSGHIDYFKHAYDWTEKASLCCPIDMQDRLQSQLNHIKNTILDINKAGKKFKKGMKNETKRVV